MEKTQSLITGALCANGAPGAEVLVPKSGSPTSPIVSPVHVKFEHFFAGHADSVIPRVPKKPLSAADIAELEEKLQAAIQKLHLANKKQAEMARDLSLLKLEKEQVETSMEMELQSAEEKIHALEKEISTLGDLDAQVRAFHEEQRYWEDERAELEGRRKEVETLERRLEVLEEESSQLTEMKRLLDQKDRETLQLRQQWEADRIKWAQEKSSAEDGASAQLDESFDALQMIIQKHGVMLASRNTRPSLSEIVESISGHLDRATETRIALEEDLRSGIDKHKGLAQALEEARAEREESRSEIRFLESQTRVGFTPILRLMLLMLGLRNNRTGLRRWLLRRLPYQLHQSNIRAMLKK
jgi:DNA repair exonuclease SbcCD ATPase subunit